MNNIRQEFTIKDLENISGVKAHTIRIWEKRYNLLKPKRTDTNIRLYSNKNLEKLLNIVLLNNNNFKISKIAKMSDEELLLQCNEMAIKSLHKHEAINSFKLAMFNFDTVLFNSTYDKLLLKMTFRDVFKDVFIPFLEHIGLLWHTDTLIPAYEHFVSNLITQKIQINTEKITSNTSNTAKTYVLYLPENEIHELGLLYLNYELNLRGNNTIYLGQSLPFDNLNYFLSSKNKYCFITYMTIMPYDSKVKEYFKEADALLNDSEAEFIAIGRKTDLVKNLNFKSNIKLHKSVSDLLKEL
ncbi:MAG: MerR family transcriptional regulator [Polaribacter sp.]|nr:MerR family transcriptional regulator [Polaribacter sp.]MDG1227644.1 MerR family transcriptional regulator [Polaribacter sp.]